MNREKGREGFSRFFAVSIKKEGNEELNEKASDSVFIASFAAQA